MKQVSLKDIALRCGVSMQTVSRSLHSSESGGTTKVSSATRERVLSVARELGYRSNPLAVSLRGGKSRSIGIIQSPYRTEASRALLNSVIRHFRRLSFETYIANLPMSRDHRAIEELLDCFALRNVDGILLLHVGGDVPESYHQLPVLRIGPGSHCLGVDTASGADALMEHLIGVHGHRRIGFLGIGPHPERESGYYRVLSRHGIQWDDDWIIRFQKNPRGMEQLRHAIEHEHLTAFMCVNDYVAARTSHYLQQQGIRVPEDVALVGFDGMAYTKFTTPSITTMIQPLEELGKRAAEMMVDRVLGNRDFPSSPVLLPSRLRLGGSCGCAEPHQKHVVWINSFLTIEEEELSAQNYDPVPLPGEFCE